MVRRSGLLDSSLLDSVNRTDQPDSRAGSGCLLLQVLAVVEDESRCRSAAELLLDRACRRWEGRSDCDHFPPLQRWRTVESGCLGGVESLPEELIAAVASGRRPHARDLARGMQLAVVLNAGCPAVVSDTELPGHGSGGLSDSPRHGLLVSMYGLREDDLSLAESVVTGCVGLGALQLVERFTRWLSLSPSSAAGRSPDAEVRLLNSPRRVRVARTPGACGDAAEPDRAQPRRG